MRCLHVVFFVTMITLSWGAGPSAAAQDSGRIEGVVSYAEGAALGGVTVLLERESAAVAATITDSRGRFDFDRVAAGTYDLRLTLGQRSQVEDGLTVRPGETTEVSATVPWDDVSFAETITVTSASRRLERIVDAPAAITKVSSDTIELTAATGQTAKHLEFTPGVQVTQSGIHDFNLNTRGFNQPLTRRVQTLVDGRDVAIPFLSGQEWSVLATLGDDLESMELLRGPSAALHGPNSFNGVLSMVTKAPRTSQGGLARVTAGELDTFNLGLRWAGALSDRWYLKLVGGYNQGDDFNRSRDVKVEYPGLVPEGVPLPADDNEMTTALVRADFQPVESRLLTLEVGYADGGGTLFVTPAGRSLIQDVERQWFRFNYNTPRWNLLGSANERDAPNGLNMANGGLFFLASDNYYLEAQGNLDFAEGRGRLVGGISYGEEEVTSDDPQGNPTIIPATVNSDREAVFGQLDYAFTDRLKLVAAARWDDSSLHQSQVSPKASLVFSATPSHTLRLSYNEAFQRANYGEFFIEFPAGALDLSFFENLLAPQLGGVPLGLAQVPIAVLGNRSLKVEQIRSWEIGYSGILGRKVFLNVNYYNNQLEDFITDVLPGVNPDFGPYQAPAALPPAVAALVEDTLNGAVPGLSNEAAGGPLFALSFGNAGRVDSQGIEIAVDWALAPGWAFDFSYSWFDFEVKESLNNVAIPSNSPEHSLHAGLTHRRDRFQGALRFRWNDDFFWQSGVHVGPVPSYEVVDLDARYDLTEKLELGITISNLLNDEHYELFGGDLIARRALASVVYRW